MNTNLVTPIAVLAGFCLTVALSAKAEKPVSLDKGLHHLRVGEKREWSSFPESVQDSEWKIAFDSPQSNETEWAIRLRQQDVKQSWEVALNGKTLGRLERDENDMTIFLAVPKNAIRAGKNELVVRPQTERVKSPDDIRVGDVKLIKQPVKKALGEAVLKVSVVDRDTGKPSPARITIMDTEGTLQSTGAVSNDHLAVRPGTVYTSTGQAKIPLPAGDYKIFAGRGFEYSLASKTITLSAGESVERPLEIRREVPTSGWAACDTHVHTLTHSGHGDSTVHERMITLAGEGIELPIATDHNVQIDHRPFAKTANVDSFFTPVIGNEVTTPVVHFNIFPVDAEAAPPNHRVKDWGPILDGIYETPGVKVAILNHARDLHSGIRPFGPKHFNDAVGENLDDWPMRFNAMEVINSSATQTEPLQLFHDWMTLLNRGYDITPVGSSDSHDVARHFVGQGRTYIRCDDRDPGAIDVDQVVSNFLAGRVMVSYGLLTELVVDKKYSAGDLATVPGETINLQIRILGPHWTKADKLRLYANGDVIREMEIPESKEDQPRGVLWQGKLQIPRPKHDAHLVAVATGPGIEAGYWKTAKPYQPTSPDWNPRVIGASGAVWIDGDRDGKRSSAYDYAAIAMAKSQSELSRLLENLGPYDTAVSMQAASLYQDTGKSLLSKESQQTINGAQPHVKRGFQTYLAAWRETQIARSQSQ